MPAATETDVIGACVAYGRTLTSVTALTSTRISATRQKAWVMPTYAIVVQGPFGGPGPLGAGLTEERVDWWCYGSGDEPGTRERTAKILAARLAYALFRPDLNGPPPFVAAGTRVTDMRAAGGRIFLVDPDTGWGYVVVQSIVKYSEIPV